MNILCAGHDLAGLLSTGDAVLPKTEFRGHRWPHFSDANQSRYSKSLFVER